ncbi:MAG TPA: NAD-dependent epimerase/dehydratase family protein [Thermohalobaculum sp.]|nr:NAD-dependent epimerase/dehydratase family protein [Thermohalobaculum sp.]
MTQGDEQTQTAGRPAAGRLAAVTGVTGFIGGHLAGELARRGWRVRALVRSMPRWHGIEPAPAGAGPIELVLGSLADTRALGALVEGADAVVHLAGAIRGRGPADFMRANAEGTGALARAWAQEASGARFVLVSSLAAREPGLSAYAASKRAAEDRLRAAGGRGPWQILRPAAVYGPGDRETLGIFRAARGPVQPVLGAAGARLALVHVADLVRAIIAALEAELEPGVHEVTDARHAGYAWAEIAAAAAAALGRPSRPFRVPAPLIRGLGLAGDLTARLGSAPMLTSGKAREILHADWGSSPQRQLPPAIWQPRLPIDQGFAETVAWYRKAGWL